MLFIFRRPESCRGRVPLAHEDAALVRSIDRTSERGLWSAAAQILLSLGRPTIATIYAAEREVADSTVVQGLF
jgi:hypothetical protein